MPDPVRAMPFRLPSEHYLRIPLGENTDRAINIFTSAQPVLGARATATAGVGPAGTELSSMMELVGPALVLRDPWFAALLRPTLGVGLAQSEASITAGIRAEIGGSLSVVLNTHGPAPVVPRIAAGAFLSAGDAEPYFEAGVDIPVTRSADGAISLGMGYRYEGSGVHGAVFSLSADFGDYIARSMQGRLFSEE